MYPFSSISRQLDEKDCSDLNYLLPTAESLAVLFLRQFIKEKLFIQIIFQAVHKYLLNLYVEVLGNMIANWNTERLIILILFECGNALI